MLRSALAVAVGLACAAVVIALATALTTFSMDGEPSGVEIPFGLGLLIGAAAASVGLMAWAVVRRR